MIELREIYTEEINRKIIQTKQVTCKELVAFCDVNEALKKLLNFECFKPLCEFLDFQKENFLYSDERRLYDKSIDTDDVIKYKIESIPSNELIEKFVKPKNTSYDEFTILEITELLDYAGHLLYLTNYDQTNFFLVRVFASLLLADMTDELYNRTKGNATQA